MRTIAVAVVVLIAVAESLQGVAAPKKAEAKLSIYVGPQIREGFVDIDSGIRDSIKDIQNELRWHRQFQIVRSPEGADLLLLVIRRGRGRQIDGAVPLSRLRSPGPSYARVVETVLRIGTYEKAIIGETGIWRDCAEQIVNDVAAWVNANPTLPPARTLVASAPSAAGLPPPAAPTVPVRTVRWMDGATHSKQFLLNGHVARVIAADSVVALALIESTDDPLHIRLHFLNRSEQPFDVIPEFFTLSVVEPTPKALAYVSPKQIAKRIENDAAWAMVGEALASFGRALSGSTTSTSGSVMASDSSGRTAYGTYNGLVTTYDSTANQQQTAANLAAITTSAEAQKIRQLTGALLSNTVFSGQDFGGVVHFKREKRAVTMLLRVPVSNQILEFPLAMPK